MTALLPREGCWQYWSSSTPLTKQQRSPVESLKPSKCQCQNTTFQGAEKEQINISHVCRGAALQEDKGKRALSMLYELRRKADG